MDDGSMKSVMTAFSHAYADRQGNAFPGITLYDAWSSGAEMEMPDVECLGIVHDLLDDWKTWKAPVRKQESLYDAIGELFVKARLCLRGFLDLQAAILAVASATASLLAHRLFAAVSAVSRRKLMSLDIGAAFLKGMTFAELAKDPREVLTLGLERMQALIEE